MSSPVGKTCPYCQYPIKPGEPVIECGQCGMPHHKACWEHNGGCTTYGCSGTQSHQPVHSNIPPGSDYIDLTDIGQEWDTEVAPSYQPPPNAGSTGSEAPLVAASKSLAGSGGVIGAIIGGIIGLAGGGIGCLPGAILGFFIGCVLGGVILYAIILAIAGGIGYAFGSAGGADAAAGGAAIGLIVGVIIIIIGCCKQN
ncbi:MAG: RING finger protein [Armatimonadota bacterium]|jgi:hypothetical protein